MARQYMQTRLSRQRTTEDETSQQQTLQVPESMTETQNDGQSQNNETQALMEPQVGHSFSQLQVRAKRDADANASDSETAMGPEGGQLSPHLTASIQAERGSGTPLNAPARAQMEQAFGTSFADVRLHSGSTSSMFNQSVGAHAFTVGSDIFLGSKASPEETPLLAHELTHVVQQRGMASAGPMVVGPANDSYEQEADIASAAITTNASPAVGSVAGQANQLQRLSMTGTTHTATTGQRIQRAKKPTAEQQAIKDLQAHQAEEDQRLDAVEQHNKAQDKHLKALDLDRLWQSKFDKQLSSYQEAIDRISSGLQNAAKGFQEAQEKQKETEEMVMGIIKGAVTLAGGFEWAFAEKIGKLAGFEGEVAEKIGGHVFAVAHSVADIAADHAKEGIKAGKAPESEEIPGASTPAGGGGGDPLAFLTTNSAALEHQRQKILSAFIQRSIVMQNGADDDWLGFDLGEQEKVYETLFNGFKQFSSAEKLKPDAEIALVLERHIWANWISAQSAQVDKEMKDTMMGAELYAEMEMASEQKRGSMFTPGADIEKRLKELNIDILASVELTGHWYSSNSPDNWRDMLIDWSHKYEQGISKE